jgi:threonine synthase
VNEAVYQRCIENQCGGTLAVEDTRFVCPRCGSLVDVAYDWSRLPVTDSLTFLKSDGASETIRWLLAASGASANYCRLPNRVG